MSKTVQILGAALMTLMLAGCGQKGPLYMPAAATAHVSAAAAAR